MISSWVPMGCIRKFAQTVFGDHLKPRFTGEGVWRYNVSRPPDADYGSIYASPDGPRAGLIPLTEKRPTSSESVLSRAIPVSLRTNWPTLCAIA